MSLGKTPLFGFHLWFHRVVWIILLLQFALSPFHLFQFKNKFWFVSIFTPLELSAFQSNTLPHLPATHCNTNDCDTQQHTATHMTATHTLQTTATHSNTLQHTWLQHTATHCNTHDCNTLHYKRLQHTATHCNTHDCNTNTTTSPSVYSPDTLFIFIFCFLMHILFSKIYCIRAINFSIKHTLPHLPDTLQHTPTHYNTL